METLEVANGYDMLENQVTEILGECSKQNLFKVSTEDLWQMYLEQIPEMYRQHYNCNCCRKFIEDFGGLVYIRPNGQQVSAVWDHEQAPEFFKFSVCGMKRIVEHRKIQGQFFSSLNMFGRNKTVAESPKYKGTVWTHLSAKNNSPWYHKLLTDSQKEAERLEEFKMMINQPYKLATVKEAIRILESDALYRSEKGLEAAKWLCSLLESCNKSNKYNLIWKAVAEAPPGFAHIKNNVVATLMDDIETGLPFEVISRKWKEKLHPLQYQRPTAAPSEGAINQAEKIFKTMNLERSLERRYATLDDVTHKLWLPSAPAVPEKVGIFDHLRPKAMPLTPTELPARNITWEKFMPLIGSANSIQVKLGLGDNCYGLITATHADAEIMLQWGNPVSWYFVSPTPSLSYWNLGYGWHDVTCIFNSPDTWNSPSNHHGKKVMFAVKDCRPQTEASLCLFPECLKTELREVRKVIEAYSKSGKALGREFGNANGITYDGDRILTVKLNNLDIYNIDRWE